MCTIPFRSERDKNSFVLLTVHEDEMENMIPHQRSALLTSMKTKGKASYYRANFIKKIKEDTGSTENELKISEAIYVI